MAKLIFTALLAVFLLAPQPSLQAEGDEKFLNGKPFGILKKAIDDNTFDINMALGDIVDINKRISDLPGSTDSDVVFSGYFPGGSEAGYDTRKAWVAFRSNATGPFTSIAIRNPGGAIVACTDPINSTLLAMALNSSVLSSDPTVLLSVTCDARIWNVGHCGGPGGTELNAGSNSLICGCNTQDVVVRPRVDNSSWGGIGGVSCSAENQTIEVILTR